MSNPINKDLSPIPQEIKSIKKDKPKLEPATNVVKKTLNELSEAVREKLAPLVGRVKTLDLPQFLIGHLQKSKGDLEEFQSLKDYEIDADQMTESLGTALRRITDRIELNENRKNNVEGTVNNEERIARTEAFINTGLENLLTSSINIASVYKEKGLPPELKEQLAIIRDVGQQRGIELASNLSNVLNPSILPNAIKETRVGKMRRRAVSVNDVATSKLNPMRSRGKSTSTALTRTEKSLQTPEKAMKEQLDDLKNLMSDLQKSGTKLIIKNGKFHAKDSGDLKENSIVINVINEMALSAIRIDNQHENSDVSKNLLDQLNALKNTKWGEHNSSNLNRITEGLNESIGARNVAKIQSQFSENSSIEDSKNLLNQLDILQKNGLSSSNLLELKSKITEHITEKMTQLLESVIFLDNSVEVAELLSPVKMKTTIKEEHMPFLLTGLVNDQNFVQSFQKYSAYIMNPEDMAKTLKSTLELVNAQTNPELKKSMMEHLVTSCLLIAEASRVNTTGFQSALPASLHQQMSEIALASNHMEEYSGSSLLNNLKPKNLNVKSFEDLKKIPNMNTPEIQSNINRYTNEMMDKIRSGEIGDSEKDEFLQKATEDLRAIGSYYVGSISPMEFQGWAWSKKDLQNNAPHIVGYTEAINWLTDKVNDDIISSASSENKPKKNQKAAINVLETYIQLMDSCIQDGNLMAAYGIFTALNSGITVSMLTRMETQKIYSITDNSLWENAINLFSFESNKDNLRTHVNELINENKNQIIDLTLTTKDLEITNEMPGNGSKLEVINKALTIFEKAKPNTPKPFPSLQTSLFDTEMPKIDQSKQFSLLNATVPKPPEK